MNTLVANPGLRGSASVDQSADAFCQYWLAQAQLRMRRELTWLWRHQRPVDWVSEALEQGAVAEKRREYFAQDETARFLEEELEGLGAEPRIKRPQRGSFAWVARQLELTAGETFVAALALAAGRDALKGNLFAALHGDSHKRLPTLGLAQWLWEDAEALLPLLTGTHSLYRLGILKHGEVFGGDEWSAAISMPAVVIQSFAAPLRGLPQGLERVATGHEKARVLPAAMELLGQRMTATPDALRVVPVAMPFGGQGIESAAIGAALRGLASRTRRGILAPKAGLGLNPANLAGLGTVCWLTNADLVLPTRGLPHEEQWQAALDSFPIYVFASAAQGEISNCADARTLPVLQVPALTLEESQAAWQAALEKNAVTADAGAVALAAQRFRFGAEAIGRVAASLAGGEATRARLVLACEQEIGLQIGSNARLVAPRFTRQELVLDAERGKQFDELLGAMEHIAEVHAHWGTGRAWGNAGISALFAGAPGTGKTMAAEVLAAQLQLPMYRIDLSQVVNKYIGETEKNLRRLFDASEQADVLLFFDEADALFGQRTQVKSSNDRFANLEVSYLLERMENFRGLAVLATNRKKDLDEAFLRRLRYVIEFPLPGEAERAAIWRKAIPAEVAAEGIDFAYLAREFALAGGHIRSIVLNACLQAAGRGAKPRLGMRELTRAVMREYEKLGRQLSPQQLEVAQRFEHPAEAR